MAKEPNFKSAELTPIPDSNRSAPVGFEIPPRDEEVTRSRGRLSRVLTNPKILAAAIFATVMGGASLDDAKDNIASTAAEVVDGTPDSLERMEQEVIRRLDPTGQSNEVQFRHAIAQLEGEGAINPETLEIGGKAYELLIASLRSGKGDSTNYYTGVRQTEGNPRMVLTEAITVPDEKNEDGRGAKIIMDWTLKKLGHAKTELAQN